ncbi:MAG: nucleoid DNA-binding protein [Pirellulaceae bacterium]|jgi:nucleoid DNA-binding protein
MAKKKATTAPKALTKTQLYANVAEATGLSKKDISAVFDALTEQIKDSVSKKGPRQFTLPGLIKIVVKHKEALPRREVRNPGTGLMVWADPKPAHDQIKVRPLKALKDMV